nr:hypothetical protein [Pandoravirus belohorizontensis]
MSWRRQRGPRHPLAAPRLFGVGGTTQANFSCLLVSFLRHDHKPVVIGPYFHGEKKTRGLLFFLSLAPHGGRVGDIAARARLGRDPAMHAGLWVCTRARSLSFPLPQATKGTKKQHRKTSLCHRRDHKAASLLNPHTHKGPFATQPFSQRYLFPVGFLFHFLLVFHIRSRVPLCRGARCVLGTRIFFFCCTFCSLAIFSPPPFASFWGAVRIRACAASRADTVATESERRAAGGRPSHFSFDYEIGIVLMGGISPSIAIALPFAFHSLSGVCTHRDALVVLAQLPARFSPFFLLGWVAPTATQSRGARLPFRASPARTD